MMKREEMEAHLADLNGEQGELETAIEAMITEMAAASPEDRKTGLWGSNGASTRKYLELVDRQAEVEAAIIELNRAIRAADGADA
jgi:hypothetical protein